MRKFAGIAIPAGIVLMSAGLVYAQRGSSDWTTSGGDAQRSSWLRSDAKISLESLEKPGFQMIWKVKLNDSGTSSLTDAVLLNFYIGYRGFRSFAFLGGPGNNISAVDTDVSRIEWQKHLPGGGPSPCSASLITQVARPTGLEIPAEGGGGGRGRSAFARGNVGEANQGANIPESPRRNFVPPPAAGRGARGGRNGGRAGAPAYSPFQRAPAYLYALTSDGMLHQMYVSNGEEPEPAFKFLPASANAGGLIVTEGTAYVITTKGCGGVPEGVWALDLQSKKVVSWKGAVVGSAGIAFDPDGTLYVATASGSGSHANSLVALDPKTLEPKDWYTAESGFTSTPVIFEYKDKLLTAAATSDGQLHLLDTKSLGGSDHKTPLSRADAGSQTSGFAPGALASWQDSHRTRWVLAPAAHAVVAWKVADQNGSPALASGWVSDAIESPLQPMIVNGVVFAAAAGKPSSPAVLYALNPSTGKELWNSGRDIGSYLPSGGLSAGGTQLYLGAADGTIYAFGFPIEH